MMLNGCINVFSIKTMSIKYQDCEEIPFSAIRYKQIEK
jgi:hypothetical protein